VSTAAFLAPRPAPPHDPLRLRLSASDGWRDAGASATAGIAVPHGPGPLTLAVTAPPGPGLLDPLGTLGGLWPPPFVALAPEEAIYLLDRAGRRLLWFDPCTCRFVALPCLLPPGPADPRALAQPVAVAANRALLALADGSDGGAVVVIGHHDLAVRQVLRRDWRPGPLAFDGRGYLYVSDLKSGSVHRFAPDFRPAGSAAELGLIYGIAIDRSDRPYVISADALRRFTPGLVPLDCPDDIEAIRGAFAPLPFAVDGAGRLMLGAVCRAAGANPAGDGLFDAGGAAVAGAARPWPGAVFAPTGRFVTAALDSHIASCVWHRIVLGVDLPAHTRLTVRARTDEIEMPIDLVAPPSDTAWSAAQAWRGPLQRNVECLFTTPPGRYLWLELGLSGPGDATPAIAAAEIEFPRIRLRRYLPAALATDPVNGDFADRFLALFDQNFRSFERRIDDVAALFDPRSTPAGLLAWLSGWVGLPLPGGVSPAEQRRLLREAPRLYARRGTVEGLRELLILYLGLDHARCPPVHCRWGPTCPPPPVPSRLPRMVLEHWRLRRWLVLGQGRLGAASRLWGERILNRSRLDEGAELGVTQLKLERDPIRDPFHAEAHIFSVFLPAGRAKTAPARQRIEALVRRETPAHTLPVVHWVDANMRLGVQSMLGFDTVIGMKPSTPIELDTAKLGRATVLKPEAPIAPGLTIGRPGSVGFGFGTRLG
jgi:phage tail-like protein